MYLYLKQRVFSWGQKFDVYNEKGEMVYYVQGQVMTIGRKIHIYNHLNQEVAFIQQKIFSFRPQYEIMVNGQHVDTLVKSITFLTHNYRYLGRKWYISGDVFAHNYALYDGNMQVMTIEKKWLTWGDTYQININDNYSILFCLASAIIIDCGCHEK